MGELNHGRPLSHMKYITQLCDTGRVIHGCIVEQNGRLRKRP